MLVEKTVIVELGESQPRFYQKIFQGSDCSLLCISASKQVPMFKMLLLFKLCKEYH